MDTTSGANETSASAAAQAAEQLKTTLSSADSRVQQGFQTLGLVHQARLSQASRTVTALTAQYGANDPRVQAAQASVAATQTTIARVSMVSQQLAAPAVQAANTGWAIQGYVRDSQNNPMAKFTVFLADSNHEFVKQYGFSYTDDSGYFLINYAGDSAQSAQAASEVQATPGAQPTLTVQPTLTAQAPLTLQAKPTAQLFVAVVNADANPVYLGSAAFEPVLGTVTYQDISVPAGGQTLGDPTKAIRAVAFPGKDDKAQKGTAKTNPAKS